MKKCFAQLSLALFLAVTGTSAALADTISFDNPPCAAISPGVFPGDCYRSLGVFFGSIGTSTGVNAFTIAADPSAASAPSVARPVGGFVALSAAFVIPPPGHGFGTSAVSLNVTGSMPGQNPWQLIFQGMESELERFSGVTDQRITLSQAPMEIHGPAFELRFLIGNPFQGIDNLTVGVGTTVVDPSVTPEPATLLLVAAGGLALLRRRKRSVASS